MPTPEASLHYLVIDIQQDRPILVFLGRDPAETGGAAGRPVHLEMLPVSARFGRPGRPALGKPVLGQARESRTRFREFATSEDLWEAGFLPVSQYRVCDDWEEYVSPWDASPFNQETAADAASET